MIHARTIRASAGGWLLVTCVAGCPKKDDVGTDAQVAATGAPAVSAPSPVATAEDAGAAPPLPTPDRTATAARPPPALPTSTDAGAAPEPGGAAAPPGEAGDTCCCEIPGQPLATVGQSECTKGKRGRCVKKARCAAATPAPGQTCCCDTAGKKEIANQSDCTRGKKGQCVKLAECK